MGKQIIGDPLVINGRRLSLSRAVRAGDFVFLTGQVPIQNNAIMTHGDIEDQTIKNNGQVLLNKMDGWDKKMMQRKSLAYDDVENFPNKFLADYLFILDEIKGDIPNVSEGILKSLESLDKKWDSLKEEIDNINENDIPSFNNELWKSGIGALN